MQGLVDQLAYAGNEAARRYLNGQIDRAAAAAWLERYALMPKDRAAQRVRFFDQYRSYVINYNLGKGSRPPVHRAPGRRGGQRRHAAGLSSRSCCRRRASRRLSSNAWAPLANWLEIGDEL